MEEIEKKARVAIIHNMWTFLWGILVLEFGFYFYYLASKTLFLASGMYVIKRILIPFAVNLTCYLVANHFNRKEGLSEIKKRYICSFAFVTFGGSLAIFHSFFTPLWLMPIIGLVYCSMFRDRKMLQYLAIYACFLTALACLYLCMERQDQAAEYVQILLISLLINVIVTMTAFALINHEDDISGLITASFEEKEVFKMRLETDQLTKVHSRPYLMEYGTAALRKADLGHPVSMAIIDLDHFKNVNDTYGHENGDVVLSALGEMALQHMKEDHITVGRYGGEEFVVIFERGSIEEHKDLLERMRVEFSEKTFPFSGDHITFSSGIVSLERPVSFEEAFRVADKALYRSKDGGRNRVTALKI